MQSIEVVAAMPSAYQNFLSKDALTFIERLAQEFSYERKRLLYRRYRVQKRINSGVLPAFLLETKNIRAKNWQVAPAPKDLQKRWVEITGPASNRKMVINALNSGADVYMSDAEDSESPTWNNILRGQYNLFDAVRRTITESGKEKVYFLNEHVATLMFRPRGWHLVEKHVLVNGKPISASLFDFGLYVFHNAKELLDRSSGPYFYLPKLESRYEARLWNNIFDFTEDYLRIPRGSIKATVLIETILAGFEMDEILYELRKHSAGLNCGRWDYIFSFIKKFQNYPGFVLPDRSQVTMDKGFLNAYVTLLVQTCHKRGAHAMGGMAAQIPIKNDPEANEMALEKVRADKLREVNAGHDGTWVAHPGLVPIAREIFEQRMRGDHQFGVLRSEEKVTEQDLLLIPGGEITEAGLRANISIGIQYLGAWLAGIGCVPLNNLMEDAATAEISRSQVWQWLTHGATLSNGTAVTEKLIHDLYIEEMERIRTRVAKTLYEKAYAPAGVIFRNMTTGLMKIHNTFGDFLTTSAYDYLIKLEDSQSD